MTATVDSLIHEYARQYTAHDAEAVTELCLYPFLVIREGVAIHLADRDAVRNHFATMMDAYRGAGPPTWCRSRSTLTNLVSTRRSLPCAGSR